MIRVQDLSRLLHERGQSEPPPLAELQPRLPYPDGWFAVAFADELRPGSVLRRRFMGEDLVVYRTRSGVVRVVDPYCPHLGAHLGHGGRVEGEAIVCPFHAFAFGAEGACVRTGYGTRPPAMRLVQHEVREVNGAIFVWHHAAGAPPTWEIAPQSAEGFPPPFRDVSTLVDHPQEVVENAVDIGHIGPLHGYRNACVRQPFEEHGPSFTVAARGERVLPLVGTIEVVFDIVVHGLGHIWVDARIPRLRAAATFQAMPTPLDPLHVAIRFGVALRAGGGPAGSHARMLLSRLLTVGLGPAFRRDQMQDFPVWQHKVYVAQPRLAKGDGPIPAYRRWARQFYSQPAADGGNGTSVRALSADR
ncbi:MAG TPA: Rieske 2Fe-2S domain-containing protein [Conexibacter sp.]|jgi:nitrite reductase/ring-hydroxylating ferredoxin subunit|nr:Rieske 2Fe-2S domain-containing protein [Conexibacter sp.]